MSDVEKSTEFAAVDSSLVEAEQLVHEMRNQLEAANSLTQPLSPMLKLNVDCFEELFEWLSLAELRVLRETCRRLKQVVDYHIRVNYPTIQLGFGKLVLHSKLFEKFREIDAVSLKLIKQITIWAEVLTNEKVDTFKDVLPQIEKLFLGVSRFNGDFHEDILKWCTHLKCLIIHHIQMDKPMDEENVWLHRQYPTIEHIVLDDKGNGGHGDGWETPELKTFLELNPNIQTLSTTFHYFWENRDCWLGSNIKLDRLNVTGDCFYENGMDRICGLLNLLHEQGFYKRLRMHSSFLFQQSDIDHITSVKALEHLYLAHVDIETTLPPMPDLKELCILHDYDFDNLGRNVSNLMNLEKVYFKISGLDVLQTFVHQVSNVKEIHIERFEDEVHKTEIINVSELNELRNELAGARKITIYVAEDIFLATKWATGITDSPLVELKRAEAAD